MTSLKRRLERSPGRSRRRPVSGRRQIGILVLSVLLALAVLAGLAWANISFAAHYPGGVEFLLPWSGVRAYLEQTDPYGAAVGEAVQRAAYGRPAPAGEFPYYLDYPFTILLLYFPFGLIPDFTLARGLWMLLLELAFFGLIFAGLRLADWYPGRLMLALLLLLALFWYPLLAALLAGGAAIWLALVYAGILWSLQHEADELAGALIALALFAWQIGGVFLLLILGRVIGLRRGRVFAGLGMAAFVLLAASFLVYPGWVLPFLRASFADLRAGGGLTPGEIFRALWPQFGGWPGWALTALLLAFMLMEWGTARLADAYRFYWTACLTLAITPLLGIPTEAANWPVLLLPVMLIFSIARRRWARRRNWVTIGLSLLFFVGPWGLYVYGIVRPAAPPLAWLLMLLPAVTVLGLYWMRWWAIRPPVTWMDQLARGEIR